MFSFLIAIFVMSDILLACYVDSTKTGENSDISKCFENFVYQAFRFLTRFYAAELRFFRKKRKLSILTMCVYKQMINIFMRHIGVKNHGVMSCPSLTPFMYLIGYSMNLYRITRFMKYGWIMFEIDYIQQIWIRMKCSI